MDIVTIATLIGEVGVLIISLAPVIANVRKISAGTKCQLRAEMLRIYYRNREKKEIHQYEFENFVLLYESYKALRGNSFIDKIFDEIKTWTIVP